MSQRLIFCGILSFSLLFVSGAIGYRLGYRDCSRVQFKLSLFNLLKIDEGAVSPNQNDILNFFKAQTYSTARCVPDSWLPSQKDFGPVHSHLYPGLNLIKDPTSLIPDYEQWRERTRKIRSESK
jgi:hypothetical protein